MGDYSISTGTFSPGGGHLRVQINPFCGHTGYDEAGSMWGMVGGFLVTSFNLTPHLFDEGWVGCEELHNHQPGLHCPPPSVPVEE